MMRVRMLLISLVLTGAHGNPQQFVFSTLFTSQDVSTYLANASATADAVAWARNFGLGKVYLETFRDNQTAPSALLRAAKAAFESAGLVVVGCVCTSKIGVSSTNYTGVSNYAIAQTQAQTAQIFAYAAAHFDEIIIDDFFFTDDESAASKASLAARKVTLWPTGATPRTTTIDFDVGKDASCTGPRGCDWSYQRRAMMKAVAQRDVLAAAKAVNPQVTVILKFPNCALRHTNRNQLFPPKACAPPCLSFVRPAFDSRTITGYDHYQDHGYDVGALAEDGTGLFPAAWVGTETRDYVAGRAGCSWAESIPVTLGAFNLRWHASVRSGGKTALGSWYDTLCCSPASYVEQARQAVRCARHCLYRPTLAPTPA